MEDFAGIRLGNRLDLVCFRADQDGREEESVSAEVSVRVVVHGETEGMLRRGSRPVAGEEDERPPGLRLVSPTPTRISCPVVQSDLAVVSRPGTGDSLAQADVPEKTD